MRDFQSLRDFGSLMEVLVSLKRAALLLLVVAGLVAVGQAAAAATEPEAAYNLLVNPGLEAYDPPYGQWEGVDCQLAVGWQRAWSDAPAPCWMDARVFADSPLGADWVERIEGDTAQFIVATEPYTAGLWQQVTGLTPGVGYGFHAALLTIFQSSAQPPAPGTMIKQVGMDPAGGTDPRSPTVVWSEPGDTDKAWDLQQRTAVVAETPTMTVFIRVTSPYPAGPWPFLNLSILDSAILAQTPVATATAPSTSVLPSLAVTWDWELAPEGGRFKGCDLEWLDEADGMWHTWLTRTMDAEATFRGEPGHAYRFRARAWQRYPNGAWLHGPFHPQGDARTVVSGEVRRVYLPLALRQR